MRASEAIWVGRDKAKGGGLGTICQTRRHASATTVCGGKDTDHPERSVCSVLKNWLESWQDDI